MREVAINTKILNDAYRDSPDAFDAIVESTQQELSNNDTIVVILEVYIQKGKEVKRKVTQFIRVEDFDKWVNTQYPII